MKIEKKDLKAIIEQFIKETEWSRTTVSDDGRTSLMRKPTFDDFMNWMLED